MATDTHTTGRLLEALGSLRRTLLGGFACGSVLRHRAVTPSPAAQAATEHGPDHQLLADCNFFDALDAVLIRHLQDIEIPLPPVELEVVIERQRIVVDRIATHRASTIGGIQRRARTIAAWADDLTDASVEPWDRRLTAATLRDLLELDVEPRSPRGGIAA